MPTDAYEVFCPIYTGIIYNGAVTVFANYVIKYLKFDLLGSD